MSNTNTPYVAKQAATLVNPTALTVFSQLVLNQLATAPVSSAFVQYNVFNNSVSSTTQTSTQYGAHFENVNAAWFKVKAFGRVTGGTTTNWTPTLQFGRSTTAANNTTMGSLTARAFNTASGIWYLTAELVWDVTSGQISGSISGGNGSTIALDASALITPVTGQTAAVLNAATNPGAFFFSVGGLFSGTNAGNVATLDGFEVEDN
jgi:hypothetical protein